MRSPGSEGASETEGAESKLSRFPHVALTTFIGGAFTVHASPIGNENHDQR